MSSFFPGATTSWNNVITRFNDIPSFSVPKNHILSFISPKKKCIFGIHDPSGLNEGHLIYSLKNCKMILLLYEQCHFMFMFIFNHKHKHKHKHNDTH